VTGVGGPAEASRNAAAGVPRRYLIVRNPLAGSKAGIATNNCSAEKLSILAQRHGLGQDIVEPPDEAAAREIVRAAVADGVDVVVAAGGDGTVHLLAEDLLGTATALAILPCGSVMNVARALGIPRDHEAAAAVIAQGGIATIDVGEALAADGRRIRFLEAGSVGMDAAIFREVARFDQGDWASIFRTIWVAFRYRPARMRLKLDKGTLKTRALMVTISIGPYIGVGMTVAPGARLDDGLFDVRVFRGFSKWELVRHLISIAFGRRRYAPHTSTYRSATVRISSAHPLPARVDGVDLGATPVAFKTLPGALRVVIPPRPSRGSQGPAGDQPAAGGSSAAVSGRRRM
jgi:diacylglycerol kinase (ATP)